MENRVTTGTLVALAFSAALGYAAPQRPATPVAPGPTQQPPATSAPVPTPRANAPSSRSKDSTTLIGCVQAGAGPRQFTFASSASPTVPSVGGGSNATPSTVTRYELSSEGTDLQRYVGRQVEVTGTLSATDAAPRDPAAAGRPDATTIPGTPSSRTPVASRFVAKTVRDTGTAC